MKKSIFKRMLFIFEKHDIQQNRNILSYVIFLVGIIYFNIILR